MKLLEIKNNLVKISYSEGENPVLGRFIVLASGENSYVAQFVNLKSDTVSNYAIAKLIFTFTPDGVVDIYDGSIPDVSSELSILPAEELLSLLPVETAVKIGELSGLDDILSIDISVFERNFAVFADLDTHKTTFISNCVRQLFQMKEKSVVIDIDNLFEDYPKLEFTKDFKIPLNSKMIDYIFEYELAEVDAATKAVIQDIFYAVQQYIKTLDYEFIPIDNFVDVVANQYKEIQMPELALLKNKLLKYRDANVFANTKEEIFALKELLEQKNCTVISLKDINESLQKEVISFIHKTLSGFEKYIYFFVPLTDDNSDKLLLKQMINNNHVFTTFIAGCSYKYAQELRAHAQNIMLFAPQTQNHDFGMFNTFINKLGPDECIVYGKLTQGIPFIVDMSELELDLTKDDVFGDKYQFVPVTENLQLVKTDEYGNQIPVELKHEEYIEPEAPANDNPAAAIPSINQPPIEVVEDIPEENTTEEMPAPEIVQEEAAAEETLPAAEEEILPEQSIEEVPLPESTTVEPVRNILEEEPDEQELIQEEDLTIDEPSIAENIEEDTLITEPSEGLDLGSDVLTENDLDYMDDINTQTGDIIPENTEDLNIYEEPDEQPPVVPVYPAEVPVKDTDEEFCDFTQGEQVTHPRYGRGVIEKVIKYGNKTLCSISFENVGRRLLDPTISELTKLG